jgi:fructose-bisphosphate aldolase class II
MLKNLKTLLEFAEQNKSAVGSFNFTSFETIVSVIKVAEELNYPVILSHAPVHDMFYPIEIIAPVARFLAEKSKAMICLHLDHGTDVNYIKKAIDMGFTSVMYDGSSLPFDENVKNTIDVVQYAHERNVSVEAELGRIMSNGLEGSHEAKGEKSDYYTDPDEALLFVEKTNVDCLAISFGTVHGEYITEPNLNVELIKKVRKITNGLPIVMHGGSGISDSDYGKVIDAGVRKINYYTYMQIAGFKKVNKLIESHNTKYYHDIVQAGRQGIYEDVKRAVTLFSRM